LAIQESGEMYLETILLLSRNRQSVRSIDVAEEMGFSKPSVSRAVGLLRSGGYLNVDDSGYLTLTPEGAELAEKIYERHTILTRCLISLGVERSAAAEDACRIEHVISDETFEALKRYIEGKGETEA